MVILGAEQLISLPFAVACQKAGFLHKEPTHLVMAVKAPNSISDIVMTGTCMNGYHFFWLISVGLVDLFSDH